MEQGLKGSFPFLKTEAPDLAELMEAHRLPGLAGLYQGQVSKKVLFEFGEFTAPEFGLQLRNCQLVFSFLESVSPEYAMSSPSLYEALMEHGAVRGFMLDVRMKGECQGFLEAVYCENPESGRFDWTLHNMPVKLDQPFVLNITAGAYIQDLCRDMAEPICPVVEPAARPKMN